MSKAYSSEYFHFFDHVMKVLLNYFGFCKIKRSLMRNIVFNTLRCMPDEVIMYVVFGTIDPPEILLFRLLSVWILTVAV